jgi:hypothetical protein
MPLVSDSLTPADRPPSSRREPWRAILLGVLSLSLYVLSGPGRIDIIDGQVRFEVARNWLRTGRPFLADPALWRYALPGIDGFYSPYNAAGSVAGVPMLWLASHLDDPAGERARFFFSFTSGIAAAALVGVLYFALARLGLSSRSRILWSLVLGFGSYVWPLAVSTFDQAQHALFLAIAFFGAWGARNHDSVPGAAVAGLAAGILINYQESYCLLIPALALPMFLVDGGKGLVGSGESRPVRRWILLSAFAGSSAAGLALWFNFNQMRFGEPFVANRFRVGEVHPELFGNPLAGISSLLLSPGKALLFYSPVLLLGLLGWREFQKRHPGPGWALLTVTVVHLWFVGSLSFFGSDWSWGPRYLGVLLPLWIPPAAAWWDLARKAATRRFAAALIIASVAVQLLGVSVDHQRYFFERSLGEHFWADDPWFYFKHSALLARPSELRDIVLTDPPPEARGFRPGPLPESVTYCIFGSRVPSSGSQWMRRYQVFYRPRPWPLWTRTLAGGLEPPIDPAWSTLPLVVAVLAGFGLVALGRTGGVSSGHEPGRRRSDDETTVR